MEPCEYELLLQLAEAGDPKARFNLGVYCENGWGVKKDLEEAARWYRAAAEQGIPAAQYNLSLCYGHGNGVAKDPVEAARWRRLAEEHED